MVRFVYQELDFQLRSPEFGDVNSLEFTRINRRTRGGDLIIYRDATWPSAELFRMTFTLLKPEEREKLFTLISRSLGKNITFQDHEGYTWNGLITNPETPITKDNRYSETVVIEFQVVEEG